MPDAAMAPASVTVRDAIAAATRELAAAGCDTPRLDAELLLAASLGVDRARLVLDARSPVRADAEARFGQSVARRRRREPVAYILGVRGFRHISLHVDPRVLIPRPETELLVEVGIELPAGARVVDVGTGSGAVALALKDERPDLDVQGVDVSADAIAVARANAERLGLGVAFVVGDLLDPAGGPCDAVLANLPYVPTGAELAPEITRYEPAERCSPARTGSTSSEGSPPSLMRSRSWHSRSASTRETRSRGSSGAPGSPASSVFVTSPATNG